AATSTAATTAPTLFLSKRELVVPLRLEIGWAHEDCFLIDRQRGVECAVVLSVRRGEAGLEVRETEVEQSAKAKFVVLAVDDASQGFRGALRRIGGDKRRSEVVHRLRLLV